MPLVLTRRVSERVVVIHDDVQIFIKFADIRNNQPYLTVDEVKSTSVAMHPDGLPLHHSEVQPPAVNYQITRQGAELRLPGGVRCSIEVGGLLGKQAKLVITAPAEVAVHREEIWDRLRAAGETWIY